MLFYFYDLKFWISFAVFKVFPFLHLETLIYFLYFKSKQSERWHLWILEIYDLKNFSLPFYRSFQITLKLGFLLHSVFPMFIKANPCSRFLKSNILIFAENSCSHLHMTWNFCSYLQVILMLLLVLLLWNLMKLTFSHIHLKTSLTWQHNSLNLKSLWIDLIWFDF